jgi:alkylation response protein AidB-like acyl-CoA dehydrogenase
VPSLAGDGLTARYYSSVVAQKITGNAIEWCGGNGFVRDTGIEKYWRDSKVSQISI